MYTQREGREERGPWVGCACEKCVGAGTGEGGRLIITVVQLWGVGVSEVEGLGRTIGAEVFVNVCGGVRDALFRLDGGRGARELRFNEIELVG